MDTGLTLAAPPMTAPPSPTPDLRPTADAAAIIRDTTPFVPLPLPPSTGQAAAVIQSRLPLTVARNAIDDTMRVLKPFGIEMLPGLAAAASMAEDENASR